MKNLIATTSLLILASAVAMAGKPVKKPVTGYSPLWNDSPFTSKPLPPPPGEVTTPLDDWALGGVSEIEGGHMVTIFNTKNPGESQIIRPNGTMKKSKDEMEWLAPGAPGSYKVDRVEYGKNSWKETVVYLSAGGRSDKVEFDKKLLTPAPSAAAAVAPGQARPPGLPLGAPNLVPPVQPGATPGQLGQPGARPPRQRVIPPAPSAPAPGR